MRRAFDQALCRLAEEENILLLLGDLGKFTGFQEQHPNRVFNVGCMESNMINFAVGLATQGFKVVIYTVSGFTIYKAYDQIKFMIPEIKNSEGSITIFNAGPGFVYNAVGRGHYLLNDLALMEQEADVYMPKCQLEVHEAMESLANEGSFNYIRGGADDAPKELKDHFADGAVGTVVTSGTTFERVLDIVERENIPVNVESLFNSCPKWGEDVTVIEDHQQIGGIASILHGEGYNVIDHLYTPTHIPHASTDREEIWKIAGLSKEQIKEFLIKHYGQESTEV